MLVMYFLSGSTRDKHSHPFGLVCASLSFCPLCCLYSVAGYEAHSSKVVTNEDKVIRRREKPEHNGKHFGKKFFSVLPKELKHLIYHVGKNLNGSWTFF
jgi:hypothetical protein